MYQRCKFKRMEAYLIISSFFLADLGNKEV
jgi:hypothetical protein